MNIGTLFSGFAKDLLFNCNEELNLIFSTQTCKNSINKWAGDLAKYLNMEGTGFELGICLRTSPRSVYEAACFTADADYFDRHSFVLLKNDFYKDKDSDSLSIFPTTIVLNEKLSNFMVSLNENGISLDEIDDININEILLFTYLTMLQDKLKEINKE